jgi:hypothetical protein
MRSPDGRGEGVRRAPRTGRLSGSKGQCHVSTITTKAADACATAALGKRRGGLLAHGALRQASFSLMRADLPSAAQVVQLGAAHVAAALDFDRGDQRAVGLERALHAFAARDLADDEAGVEATVALGDDHAFVGLDALAGAFDDVDADDDGVAGRERREWFCSGERFLPARGSGSGPNDLGFSARSCRCATGVAAPDWCGSKQVTGTD